MANTSLGGIIADSAVLNVPRGQHMNPFQTVLNKQKTDAALNNQRKAKDAKDLGDLTKSMIVNDKDLTKPFANKIIEATADFYKKADEYTRDGQGDVIPRLIRYRDTVTQPTIMSARSGNSQALDYDKYSQDPSNLADPKLAGLLRTANSVQEVDDYIKSLNDPHLMSDNQGNFAFLAGKRFDPSKADYLKVDETRDFVVDPKGQRKRYPDPGVVEYTDRFAINPERVKQIQSSLLSDPVLAGDVFNSMSPQDRLDPEKFKAAKEQRAAQILSAVPSERYGNPQRMNLPKDTSSTRIGFGGSGTGTNERFTVTEITPGVVQDATIVQTDVGDKVAAQLRVNKGYALKDLTATENSPQFWSADKAFDVNTGKLVEGFKKKGSLVAVNEESQLEDAKGNVLHKFKNPMAVIKVEEGTGDEKVTKVYTIPYNSVKGEIKGYTTDKKGQNGWELPKSAAPSNKSNGFQTFTVKGITYKIPDSDVPEFKKDNGL